MLSFVKERNKQSFHTATHSKSHLKVKIIQEMNTGCVRSKREREVEVPQQQHFVK